MTLTSLQTLEPASSPKRHTGATVPIAWWIEDDGLLRDEGVVFGLSGLPGLPVSKVEAVEAYYRARIAQVEAARQSLQEEKERLERRADELRRKIEALAGELEPPPTDRAAAVGAEAVGDPLGSALDRTPGNSSREVDRPPTGGVFRYLLGSILAAAICGLAYFVVREVLGDRFDHPELIAAGVMLAGMFVVFAPTSLLFSSDRQHREPPWGTELWKVRLAELGFPILAAAFVVVWGDRQDPARAVMAFLFLSMLFLLGGRLLLSLVTRLGSEIERARERRSLRRQSKQRRQELERLRTEAATVDQQIAALNERIRELRTRADLEAECEHKVAVLQSEYELARAALERAASGELAGIHTGRVGVS
ncbi:MAG TPA: hypothetical protein VIL13_10930 [Longimicrobiales bacterium]